jgi:hypothetical protein
MGSSFRRLRAGRRRAAVLAAGAVVAVAAAGCSSFISQPTGSQLIPNGNVEVTSAICLAGFDSNTQPGGGSGDYSQDCQAANAGSSPEGAEQGQMLIAYLIPNGSSAAVVPTTSDLSGVTFAPSSSYVAWLDANEATPSGYRWVGYISSEFADANPEAINLIASFTVPAGASSAPYAGPYVVKQVVIGDRADGPYGSTTLDPARALNCSEVVDDVISVPAPAGTETIASDTTGCRNDASTRALSIATREFIASAPAAATRVQAGATATVPFTVRFAGPDANPFELSASTSSNALVATPVNSTYTPGGTGTTTENVSVPVPAGLQPGTYTVMLNVGAFSSAAATLDVTAPPAPTTTTTTTITPKKAPLVRPKLSSLRLTAATLRLTLRLNIAAAERLTLQRRSGRRWITLKVLSLRGSAGKHTLNLRALFGASRFTQPGSYRVLVQAFNGTLKSNKPSVRFTIR